MKFFLPEDFQPKLNLIFENEKVSIQKILPHARIEHICASSIPHAVSKGDLDIFVGVDSSGFNDAISSIKSIGYFEQKDTFRSETLCMLKKEDRTDDIAKQLVANGSEFEVFVSFRDLMINHPEYVHAYNELKTSCSGMNEDDYRKIKSEFIQKLLNEKA